MKNSLSYGMRSRMATVVTPILLLLALMAFPVARAIHSMGEESPFSQEITTDRDLVVSASGGTICWGLKRGENGSVPEIPSTYKTLMAQYGALYVGDTGKKTIYLTFDEGYENGYTAKILDTLKNHGVKAIFYITGDYFEQNPELIRRMIEEGHSVGNHSMNHPSLAAISVKQAQDEILQLHRLVEETFGYEMCFLRPPKGEFSEGVLRLCKDLNYRCMLWSFAYKDWVVSEQKGADYALETVLKNLHPGAILLLHAVSSDNAAALGEIIAKSQQAGYVFGNPEDLMP